jgi:peptide/nickel transport system ATP-binding protein
VTVLFQVTEATKRYPGSSTAALDAVSVTVEEGANLGVVGESGSGKTTLSRVMLGLLPVDSGSVSYRGESVPVGRGRHTKGFRKRVQLVLQDPYSSLSPRMRVGDIVAEPLRILGMHEPVKARVAELLSSVELDPALAARYPHQLSGGQRQRVAIARALGPRPELIVADEPLSALDVSVRVQVLQLLRRLAAEQGLTLVLVSHDIAIVDQLCRDTIVMRAGRVVEHGDTQRLLSAPEHPYTQELIASIPSLPPRPALVSPSNKPLFERSL